MLLLRVQHNPCMVCARPKFEGARSVSDLSKAMGKAFVCQFVLGTAARAARHRYVSGIRELLSAQPLQRYHPHVLIFDQFFDRRF